MDRKIKKVLKLSLLFISVFYLIVAIFSIKVNSLVIFTETSVVRSYNTENTSYKTVTGITNFNGVDNNQLIHTYIQKQTPTSKVVTWAVKQDSGALARATLAAICLDYEKTHPDYEVVGGINADQFTLGFGSSILDAGKDYYNTQPYYPMIADGEGWFVVTSLPYNGAGNVLLFNNLGSTSPIERHKVNIRSTCDRMAMGPYLYILDENDARIKKYDLNGINTAPKDNETTVYVCHNTSNNVYEDVVVTSAYPNDNVFLVNDADRCYPSNSIDYIQKDENARDAFFGKGVITQVCNKCTLSYGDFAIVTKDQSLISELKKGVKVMVQYEIDGDFGKVESAIGFHTVQRENDVDMVLSPGDAYNNRKYPRAVVGSTVDGDIFLLAIDGLQPSINAPGAHFNEINAILRYYNVINAYQMDGGGSVTACIRNENGTFDVVNHPSDGSSRRVFSALLLVEEKKPKLNLLIKEKSLDKVTLNIDFEKTNYDVKSLNMLLDNKSYDIISDDSFVNTIELNLERGIEYEYTYSYTYIENDKDHTVTLKSKILIPKLKPKIKVTRINNTFYIDITDSDENLNSYYLVVDNKTINFESGMIEIESFDTILLGYSYDNGVKLVYEAVIHPESMGLKELYDMKDNLDLILTELNLFN